jgi:hypothetical protein
LGFAETAFRRLGTGLWLCFYKRLGKNWRWLGIQKHLRVLLLQYPLGHLTQLSKCERGNSCF